MVLPPVLTVCSLSFAYHELYGAPELFIHVHLCSDTQSSATRMGSGMRVSLPTGNGQSRAVWFLCGFWRKAANAHSCSGDLSLSLSWFERPLSEPELKGCCVFLQMSFICFCF